MNRIAFSIMGFDIYWYSLCILCGVLVAYVLILKEAKKHNIDKEFITDLVFYSIIIGLVGARLYYVIFNLNYYMSNPSQIIAVWNGGLAIHGGIIFGAIFIYYYCKKKNIKFLRITDIMAPALLIAQALGRWGNFFNKEAYGIKTTYKTLKNMHIPNFVINGMKINGVYHYPTFFFESIGCIIGVIIILIIRKNKKIKLGVLSGIYFVWYGILRFFIEALRTDSLMLFSLKAAQIVSLISIIIGIVLIITSSKREKYIKEG